MVAESVPISGHSLLLTLRRSLVALSLAAILPALAFYLLLTVYGSKDVEARALIVAQELLIATDELPKTASVIYDSGGVAQRAVLENDLPFKPGDFIPGKAEIEPIAGTVTLQVVGKDVDSEKAASYANIAATALIDQLNASQGIGSFNLFEPAVAERAEASASLPKLPLSLLLGLGTATGLLFGIQVLRRPVNTVGELARTASTPITDQLQLVDGHPSVPDLDRMARRLRADTNMQWKFVGASDDAFVLRAADVLSIRFEHQNETTRATALLVTIGTAQAIVEEAVALLGADLGAAILLRPTKARE